MTLDANDITRKHGLETLVKAFDHAAPTRTVSGQGQTTDQLPLLYWGDIGTVSAPDRLVRGLLGETSLAVIYGEPGSGKTFLATDIGLHIALGRTWLGRTVTASAVLYVAGEGVTGLKNRVAGFSVKHEPGDDVPFVIVPVPINLGPGGTDADRVISAARRVELRTSQVVRLIVVDTLARSMGEGDENDAHDMGRFVKNCDHIRRETGATILIVHHRGKSSQAGPRGSSALRGAADTVIEVDKRDGLRLIKVVKQKDAADGVQIDFDLEVVRIGQDDEGKPITTCVVREVRDVVRSAPNLSKTEKRAVGLLRNMLKDFNDRPPGNGAIPNVAITIKRFRDGLKSAGVTHRDNPNSERSQWARLKKSLVDKGFLVIRDGYCWLDDKP
jgi:hypothetical protein